MYFAMTVKIQMRHTGRYSSELSYWHSGTPVLTSVLHIGFIIIAADLQHSINTTWLWRTAYITHNKYV